MSRKPDLGVSAPCLPPEQAEQIRTELQRVLNSHHFRGSRRCQNLLRHVTEQTLVGNTLCLKERTLGVEVFERSPDYDTSQDPVVRATAAETRKKLAQYYQENNGEAQARIDLLPGSYIAEFHPVVPPSPPGQRRQRSSFLLPGGIVAFLVIAVSAGVLVPRWSSSGLEDFWKPVLNSSGSVLICMGQPITYNLKSPQAQDKLQAKDHSAERDGIDPDAEVIPKKELIVLKDRYVALGDAMCLVRLTSFFDRHGKPYHVRGEQDTAYADVRESPAVLIAAFDNRWTLQVADQLRYTFVKDSARDTDMVRDRLHPENTEWKLTGAWPQWDVTDDYAIVSLIRHDANMDRPLVIAAGITQYGTMAAGDFLTDPQHFADALSTLPRDWRSKNVQIVLRVPVLHRTPGHPRVIATHAW